MTVLCSNNEKRKSLDSGATRVCNLLNTVIIPICRELSFDIDVSDKDLLDKYFRNINSLRSDYYEKTKEGANNPALSLVLEKTAETLWSSAYRNHPIANPYSIDETPRGIMEYVILEGSDIYSFHARKNNRAIEKSCNVYADEEDMAKREELEEACRALNRCFNGNAHLFSGYITIARGRFELVDRISNYKVLIYGKG